MSVEPSSPRPPSAAPDVNQQDDGEEPSYPRFEPLFTLLHNATANTTSHPRVQYIFSDDEAPILPNSRAILVDLEGAEPSSSQDGQGAGWRVKAASSLDRDYALVDAAIEEGSQLRIEAVQREPVPPAGGLSGRASKEGLRSKGSRDTLGRKGSRDTLGSAQGVEREDPNALLEEIRRRMGVMKRVVEQGERSFKALNLAQGEQQDEGEGTQRQGQEAVAEVGTEDKGKTASDGQPE